MLSDRYVPQIVKKVLLSDSCHHINSETQISAHLLSAIVHRKKKKNQAVVNRLLEAKILSPLCQLEGIIQDEKKTKWLHCQ